MSHATTDNKKQLLQLQTDEEIDKYFQDQAHFLLAKRKIETIDNFNGVFDFLNNEYPCFVYFEGRMYPSVFHAFQAARSDKDHERAKLSMAESLQEVYELATEIEDPADWQNKRLQVMETLLRDKFRRHRELREKLRKTGNRDLINTYSDRSSSNLFWGVVDGKGHNHLGTILQNIRLDVHTEKELTKWLNSVLSPQDDKFLLPKIKVEVYKEDKLVAVETLKKTPFSIFGALAECDVVLAHQSVSRQHLCILVDKSLGVVLVDLGSKGGTFLNGERIEPLIPYPVKDGDQFGVAESTRTYTIKLDFSEVQDYLEKKRRSLQLDLKILSLQQSVGNGEELVKASLGMIKQDTIFLSGLPDNTSEKEIRDAFGQFGKITDVRLPLNPRTGSTKGIAFVKYLQEEEAKKAFSIVRLPLRDKLVKIQFAEKNKGQILGELEREVQHRERANKDRRDDNHKEKKRKRSNRSSEQSEDSRSRQKLRKSHGSRNIHSRTDHHHDKNDKKLAKNRDSSKERKGKSNKRSRSRDVKADHKIRKRERINSGSSRSVEKRSGRRRKSDSGSEASSSDLSD